MDNLQTVTTTDDGHPYRGYNILHESIGGITVGADPPYQVTYYREMKAAQEAAARSNANFSYEGPVELYYFADEFLNNSLWSLILRHQPRAILEFVKTSPQWWGKDENNYKCMAEQGAYGVSIP